MGLSQLSPLGMAGTALLGMLALSIAAGAQTLAHPGWRGNGVTVDPWWKHAVIYEVYPRSFQDSDGDGIGDLKGITSRLDYVQQLGADAIWLTPIFPSPLADFGYDISDYTAIDPQFGTMDDFDDLVREAGKRHIRVLMDLVLNHTSDEHPWFKASASSLTNAKHNWYLWRDGKGSDAQGNPLPPNNWLGRTGQSAWQWSPDTKQFYYHYYDVKQPDLNWRNPAVAAAMQGIVRFWYNRGVAGFRLDAINTLYEDATFRDEPMLNATNEFAEAKTGKPAETYQRNQPEVHDVLRDLRRVSDKAGGRLLVGEIYTATTAEMAAWYGKHNDELQLPMDTSLGFLNKLDAAAFRTKLNEAEHDLNGNTPLFVFDNHDRTRSWERYGDGVHNEAIAKIVATILLATRSAALVYQGQEIGMKTTPPTRKEDVRDPRGILNWPDETTGNGGRDGERTPMQWDATANAGFTTGTPWLPIPPTFLTINVAAEEGSDDSLLRWYHQLIALRSTNPALRNGATVLLNQDAQNALVWVRKSAPGSTAHGMMLVACNMTAHPVTLNLAQQVAATGSPSGYVHPVMRTDNGMGALSLDAVTLPPFGVILGELGGTTHSSSKTTHR